MRFLVLNTDYPSFLDWLYQQEKNLEDESYVVQKKVRNESLFGVADFYSHNLKKLGHEAWDVTANSEHMQKAWAREYGLPLEDETSIRARMQIIREVASKTPIRHLKHLFRPLIRSLEKPPRWYYEILLAQIKHYQPDVLLIQAMHAFSSHFLKTVKKDVPFILGQHAANVLSDKMDWSCYDLVISSFPPTLEWFKSKGISAEYHRLGFDPRVLSYLGNREKIYDVTFIGSFYNIHSSRVDFLEDLYKHNIEINIWGPDVDSVSHNSPIRRFYRGQSWGRDMHNTFYKSKIVLNHHGDIAPYANNVRLYEATGVGSLLLTDWKVNLQDLFDDKKEVIAYHSVEECAEFIHHFLEYEQERETIALAGQKRTLGEHTYFHRMEELVEIVQRYVV